MDCGEAFVVGSVDPGLDFLFESSFIHFVTVSGFAVGFKMLEVDFHFDKIVFEGGEVQKVGSVFIDEAGKVEPWVLLQVLSQIVSRLKRCDLLERFVH